MIKSVAARISGRVQGVGFRYSALHKAKALGLRGWVKNEYDGSVTARFEGPEDAVDQYIDWLRIGPSSASVTDCQVSEMNPDDSLGPFQVTF